jgi:vacuolar-type H+-ATPase catalytic subunit A/Vma1
MNRALQAAHAELLRDNKQLLDEIAQERAFSKYLHKQLVEAEAKALRQERIIDEYRRRATGIVEWCRGQQHAFQLDGGDAEC